MTCERCGSACKFKCTFCVGASRAIVMAKSLRERIADSWNSILRVGRPMAVGDLDKGSREDAWANISASALDGALDGPNKVLELLASARNEASDLLGLLMATPGFSCGGVTASTIVYTRNGRAFHAVIHDVTDQYGDGKASGRDPDRECACGGRDFQIKSDGPNQAWLKCRRCGERQS